MDAHIKLGSYIVRFTDRLGSGTFGVVFKGKHERKDEVVAVKQCEITDDRYGFMAMKEIKNFQQLENHPNIVKLLDFHYTQNSFWMVMEYCDAGDLVKYTKTVNPSMDAKINIMYQSSSAIAFMHTRENPVVHRDIKPANIMIKMEDGVAMVKVTDFGLSKVIEEVDPGKAMMFSTAAGTPGFMAPEFYTQKQYTEAVDIFALGLVFLSLLDYKKGDKELVPLSESSKKNNLIMPIGQEMVQLHAMKIPFPKIVEEKTGDSTKVKAIKELIRKMTEFDESNRIGMGDVENKMAELCEKPLKNISIPAKKSEKTKISPQKDTAKVKPTVSEKPQPSFDSSPFQLRDSSSISSLLGTEASTAKFKVGDRVRVHRNLEAAKKLQDGHGEWQDNMRHYLGREGIITEKILHVVKVQFDDGQIWSYNPKLLHHLHEKDSDLNDSVSMTKSHGSSPPKGSIFKRFDVVKVPEDAELVKCLQKNHGGWNEKMKFSLGVKGIVNRVDKDGDVFIECINGDDWTFNPEILTHVDMSKETIEAGDFVIIQEELETVKPLHRDGWKEEMASGLGKSGIVQSVHGSKATVETRGKSYTWNRSALVLVAKGEEMLKAVLQRKM